MVESETVAPHLMYGAEYDTREKWAIEAGTVTIEEIAKDSSELGIYHTMTKVRTGEDGCINNIYGFAGNVSEWTQEKWTGGLILRVIRGGNYDGEVDDYYPVDYRISAYPVDKYNWTGFRATLYIE